MTLKPVAQFIQTISIIVVPDKHSGEKLVLLNQFFSSQSRFEKRKEFILNPRC